MRPKVSGTERQDVLEMNVLNGKVQLGLACAFPNIILPGKVISNILQHSLSDTVRSSCLLERPRWKQIVVEISIFNLEKLTHLSSCKWGPKQSEPQNGEHTAFILMGGVHDA